MTPQQQAHFRVLQILSEHPEISQRDLARQLGVSIGKTNYLIKVLRRQAETTEEGTAWPAMGPFEQPKLSEP